MSGSEDAEQGPSTDKTSAMIVKPVELPSDVVATITQRWHAVSDQDVVVLPGETRGDQTFYVEDDLDGVALARADGLSATFLHAGSDRRYLHENAAGWELQAAFAVGENVTAVGVVALIRYLWLRVRHAKNQGIYQGEEAEAPIKITLARVEQNGTSGDIKATGIHIEGQLDAISTALDRVLRATDDL